MLHECLRRAKRARRRVELGPRDCFFAIVQRRPFPCSCFRRFHLPANIAQMEARRTDIESAQAQRGSGVRYVRLPEMLQNLPSEMLTYQVKNQLPRDVAV